MSAIGFFWITAAQARVYDLYRADYPKGAFCSAIGGACAADLDLENGFFQNPAALIGHPQDWNFDGDYSPSGNVEPGAQQQNDFKEGQYMFGAGWAGERFAAAISVTGRHDTVTSNASLINEQGLTQKFPLTTDATTLKFSLPFAYLIEQGFSVGIAFNVFTFNQSMITASRARATASTPDGALHFGFTVGLQKKLSERLSLGSWFKSPMTAYSTLDFHTQALGNQLDFSEEMAIHDPWIWALGFSFTPWSDERTLFLDANIIGNTDSGYLLAYDAFTAANGDNALIPKGRNIVVEPHLGYRTPLSFGPHMTLHSGLYYETSRYADRGGRPHVTGGLSSKALSWIEVMAGADVGQDFTQIFFTFR